MTTQTCAACGAGVGDDLDRSFAFGAENWLCWRCAVERGGAFDPERETWERPPELGGLADEAYGAAAGPGRGKAS